MRNPISPPILQGIPNTAPTGCLDVSYNYVYPISLTASQLLSGQSVSILTDADFLLRGILFTSTGGFSVRLYDGQQYALASDLVFSVCLLNEAGDPFPVFPEVFYPAGGRIQLDIQDTSAATNTGQIVFVGANRFHVQ